MSMSVGEYTMYLHACLHMHINACTGELVKTKAT